MAFAEQTPEPEGDGPELTEVSLELERDAHDLMVELMARTGYDASELVTWALGAYWRELEKVVLPPPRWSKADREAIREGLAQAERGEVVSQDVVEKEIADLLAHL